MRQWLVAAIFLSLTGCITYYHPAEHDYGYEDEAVYLDEGSYYLDGSDAYYAGHHHYEDYPFSSLGRFYLSFNYYPYDVRYAYDDPWYDPYYYSPRRYYRSRYYGYNRYRHRGFHFGYYRPSYYFPYYGWSYYDGPYLGFGRRYSGYHGYHRNPYRRGRHHDRRGDHGDRDHDGDRRFTPSNRGVISDAADRRVHKRDTMQRGSEGRRIANRRVISSSASGATVVRSKQFGNRAKTGHDAKLPTPREPSSVVVRDMRGFQNRQRQVTTTRREPSRDYRERRSVNRSPSVRAPSAAEPGTRKTDTRARLPSVSRAERYRAAPAVRRPAPAATRPAPKVSTRAQAPVRSARKVSRAPSPAKPVQRPRSDSSSGQRRSSSERSSTDRRVKADRIQPR